MYEPSILLHLSHRAFDELARRGCLKEYPQYAWNQLEDRAKVSDLTHEGHRSDHICDPCPGLALAIATL